MQAGVGERSHVERDEDHPFRERGLLIRVRGLFFVNPDKWRVTNVGHLWRILSGSPLGADAKEARFILPIGNRFLQRIH